MRNSILGRIQFISVIAVLLLPLFVATVQPIYAEEVPQYSAQEQVNQSDIETKSISSVNVSSTSFGEEFLKIRNNTTRQRETDCTIENCIALTFDDGPNQQFTPLVLDTLKQFDARASFFVIGNRVPAHPEIVRRAYKEGHDIGNHSWSHPLFTKLSPDQISQEFNATQQAITQAGVPTPLLFRPPYGIRTPAALAAIPAPFILWNVDPHDWSQKDVTALTQHILTHARRGAVIVMHDTSASTVEALQRIVPELQKSYKLVTIRDLFDIKSDSRGQYFGLQ